MKRLLAHDFLLAKGGAEKFSIDFCSLFPGMELAAGFATSELSEETEQQGIHLHRLSSSLLCQFKAIRTLQTIISYKFAKPLLNSYDTVIYSGINALLAQGLQNNGHKIYYCHTPPRYIYDLREHYRSSLPPYYLFFLDQFIKYYQPRYEQAISSMDIIVANSVNVQNRLTQHLGIQSMVINPPVDIHNYQHKASEGYYLSTSRLESYKRVDSLIKAFKKMPDKKLIVASGGSDSSKLQALAEGHSNIHFTGWLTRSKLVDLVEKSIATLYVPKDEDFGMSPVESMAAGKPVVGVNEGGVKETVIDNVTGFLVSPDNLEQGIIDAVSFLNSNNALQMKKDCEQQAKKFSASVFTEKMQNLFDSLKA